MKKMKELKAVRKNLNEIICDLETRLFIETKQKRKVTITK